jgi:hypothetical protein
MRFARIKARFEQHFPHESLTLPDVMYDEGEHNYVCGVVRADDDSRFELAFRGMHGAEYVDYAITIDEPRIDGELTLRVQLRCTLPSSCSVEIFPDDDEIDVRKSNQLHAGKTAACIALTGVKSAMECWFKCKRDRQCWKECLKEKGATFGVDITACLALTD